MMRLLLGLLLALLLVIPAWAAPAFDAFTAPADCTVDDPSFSHTPSGTPRGVLVYVLSPVQSEDRVTGITYGGDTMTEVAGSPVLKATGEIMAAHLFFLGTSIPTGTQTVAITTTASTGGVRCGAITITASGDTEVVDTSTISSDSLANPSVTVSLAGRTSFVAVGGASGNIDVPGNVTPNTNWTSRDESDAGPSGTVLHTFDTIGSSDVSAGWADATAEDVVAIGVAIAEIAAGGGCSTSRLSLLGVGC